MVQDADAENLSGFAQLVLQPHVGFAGLKITGWVVVSEDHSGGAVGDDVGKDLAWVNRAFV